ncbi:MAG TPA: hypothetical protein VEH55_03535 [Gaiellaceae bacterium]|nr:hypothetical protein [Gaiellaceae bacterium]
MRSAAHAVETLLGVVGQAPAAGVPRESALAEIGAGVEDALPQVAG